MNRKGISRGAALLCETTMLATALLLHTTVLAVQVVQPGYRVEIYGGYFCPAAGGAYELPRGLACTPDGTLYVSQWRAYPDKGTLYRVSPDGSGGEWLTAFGTPRRLVWAGGSAYGDHLYLADGTSNAVFRVALDGAVSRFADAYGGVHSLGLDRQGLYGGLLYVGTRSTDRIYSISVSGRVAPFSSFPGNGPGGHLDLTFDAGTNWGQRMYVALERPAGQSGVGGVFTIDTNGQATAVAASIVTAWTVAIAPTGPFGGDLFVTGKTHDDDPTYSLWRVKPDGQVAPFAVATLGSNLLDFIFAPDGTLLVPEFSAAAQKIVVSRILATPALRAVSIPGPAGFLIEVTGKPSQRYAIETSSNLVAWSVMGYVTNNPAGTCWVTNATSPLHPPRFYRAKAEP